MSQNKKFIIQNSYLYIIFLFVIALTAWNRDLNYFAANDDFAILLDMSGGSEAPFINYLLSKFFNFLYRLEDTVNWYPLILLILQTLSIGIIFKSYLVNASNQFIKILFLLISSFFLISLSYNSVAILLSISAYGIFQNSRKNQYLLPALLLFLGSFFRSELAVIASFFCTIHCFFFLRSKLKLWFYIFLIAHSSTFGLSHVTKSFYSKNFSQFQDFNSIRGQLHGFPILNYLSEADLAAIGWTNNDLVFFKRWHFYDESKFNIETLTKLTQLKSPSENALSSMKSFSLKATKNNIPLVVIFTLYLFLVPFNSKRKKDLLFISANLLILVFLEVFLRAPDRLVVPLNLFFVLFIIGQFENNSSSYTHLYICLFVILGLHLKILNDVRINNDILSKSMKATREIIGQNNEYIFLNFDRIRVITPNVSWVNDPINSILPYGWPIFSPRYYKILRHKNFYTFKLNILSNAVKAGVLVNPNNDSKNIEFLDYFFPASEGFCYINKIEFYDIFKCK